MAKDIANSQKVEIEWSYTPEEYFEDRILLEQNGSQQGECRGF
jgi:hypothetical protein